MKLIARFLVMVLCVAPFGVANAVVSQTAGNNLTAYNGESGATNNNRWNNAMNSRSGGNETVATADFGNCNAVILRCAQPKCSSGGCSDMNVTYAIVNGCVQSNTACKKYGDELIDYISAQLVAQSTAKANAAASAAQTAAANAAAQQSAQQMAAMQQQMQQMQAEMAQQNAQQMAAMQSALDEQKQLTANAIAEATAARQVAAQPVATTANSAGPIELSETQVIAANNGVSADVLAREQISGQIMSSIENAEVQLKTLKETMRDVFEYARCDSRGNNCEGPKRVKRFKEKADGFFDPYMNVLDELYDALILAQSVGVDINDIYMMLSGSCNVWGKYLCPTKDDNLRYTTKNCGKDGVSVPDVDNVIGGARCTVGKVIPVSDGGCQPLGKMDSKDDVMYNWLYPDDGNESKTRVGCMSDMLDDSTLFRGRRKQATIDIETLQKIIAQDAPTFSRTKTDLLGKDQVKYCAVTDKTYLELQKYATLKQLPQRDICINETKLDNILKNDVLLIDDASIIEMARTDCETNRGGLFSDILYRCFCEKDQQTDTSCNLTTSQQKMEEALARVCRSYTRDANAWNGSTCNCNAAAIDQDKVNCALKFNGMALKGYVSGSTWDSVAVTNVRQKCLLWNTLDNNRGGGKYTSQEQCLCLEGDSSTMWIGGKCDCSLWGDATWDSTNLKCDLNI